MVYIYNEKERVVYIHNDKERVVYIYNDKEKGGVYIYIYIQWQLKGGVYTQ